ncbi:MAG: hypothetical protein AABY64_07070 [Bdellovibrionota bacterium]
MKSLNKFFFIFSMILLLFACGGEPPVASSDSSSNGDNPKVGQTQEDAAWVIVRDDKTFPFFMNKLGTFGQACEIKAGAANQNLDCTVDINELDLYYQGLTLQANFPTSMCTYVVHKPYWHYNYETGIGPATVAITKTTLNGTATGTTCLMDGVAGCNGTEVTYSATEGLQCIYNHTKFEGPNCCLGKYTYSETLNETGATPTVTTTNTISSWGGNYRDCIGGQAKTDWELFAKDGFPIGEISYAQGKGYNKAYQLKSILKTTGSSYSLAIANNYKRYDVATPPNHRHTGYVVATSTDVPYMVNPVDDRNGTSMPSGNIAYAWQCLDRDHEVAYSINVYVREWNTYAEFLTYGTSLGVSGNPDITGVEGTNCDYTLGSGQCDDYYDLDTATPYNLFGPHTSGNRSLYFPAIPYIN